MWPFEASFVTISRGRGSAICKRETARTESTLKLLCEFDLLYNDKACSVKIWYASQAYRQASASGLTFNLASLRALEVT